MATVKHEVSEDGTHAIGVEVDGVFVPFASHSGARIEQLVENAKTRGEQAKDEDGKGGKG